MARTGFSRRFFTLGTGATILASGGLSRAAAPAKVPARLQEISEAARGLGVRALVLVKDGQTILSHGDVSLPLRTASIHKSLLSALFGMADRKSIRLDASLAELGVDDYVGRGAASFARGLSAKSCGSPSGPWPECERRGSASVDRNVSFGSKSRHPHP